MITKADLNISNYPFIAQSTMRISAGNYLNPGTIFGASLYPIIASDRYGYLYIHSVSTKYLANSVGCFTLYDSECGDIDLEVRFPLTNNGGAYIIGSAIQGGKYRGSISARSELLAVLMFSRVFEPSDFIFTPSVYKPTLSSSTIDSAAGLYTVTGDLVNTFKYDTTAGFSEDGSVTPNTIDSADKSNPVRSLTVCGVDISTDDQIPTNLNIITKQGSAVRVLTDRKRMRIELGAADDLAVQ